MVAKGNVRSTLLPPKKPAGNTAATRRPALLGDKEPVSILSNTLTYDESIKKADYAGQTRLLQGQTTINAVQVTLDAPSRSHRDREGHTNLPDRQSESGSGSELNRPSPSGDLTYSDDTLKRPPPLARNWCGAGQPERRHAVLRSAKSKTPRQPRATGLVTRLLTSAPSGHPLDLFTRRREDVVVGAR